MNLKHVTIYGNSTGSNTQELGGWACILLYKSYQKKMAGCLKSTTKDRLQMYAVLKGLMALKEGCKVSIYTNSDHIHDAFNKGWIISWPRNGWLTAKQMPVKNQDLWKQIMNQMKDHQVKWYKVSNQLDNKWHTLCGQMAKDQVNQNRE